MNWIPDRPGWLQFHDPEPTGIRARAECEYEGIHGKECRNEPTWVATWPTRSTHPWSKFLCDSHIDSVKRIPECKAERLE